MTSQADKAAFESIRQELRALYLSLAEGVAHRNSIGMWASGTERREYEDERDLVLSCFRMMGGNTNDLRDERDAIERRHKPKADTWPARGDASHCYACGDTPAEFSRVYDVWICDNGTCEYPVIP